MVAVYVAAVIRHKLNLVKARKRFGRHAEAAGRQRRGKDTFAPAGVHAVVEPRNKLVVHRPVRRGLRILPVDVHAVKIILFHERNNLVRDRFPILRHIGVDAVVPVAPGAVRKSRHNDFDPVVGIGAHCDELAQRRNLPCKAFFADVAEVHIALLVPMHRRENKHRAVDVVEAGVIARIRFAARENLGRHVAVETLVRRYLKILGGALRLVVQAERTNAHRRIAAAELVHGQPHPVGRDRVEAAKAHRLNLFTLIDRDPLAVHKGLQAEILRLVAFLFDNGGVKCHRARKLEFNVAVVAVLLPFGRVARRVLRGPIVFVVAVEQVRGVRFFAGLKTFKRNGCARQQVLGAHCQRGKLVGGQLAGAEIDLQRQHDKHRDKR